ncbi:peptidoglycan DD-metalloendopeptidase family protein [Agrobacterium sp. a22-2]|uniref:peptidoglycan DD-metalloendopeptidase family protein n=1 Tax=Agrobacterium sp. a22-2 TaxID=2283840 RepID=UPI0014465EA5|nr:peptidoglycan DD-metalloendopeptidase family protein [Agrobacterium sp. a22-2]
MTSKTENRTFGKRRQQHIIILASGDRIRHMTVRPWMAALAFSFVGVMAIGYLAATSYLVLRDNLIGATMARQARMQHDYEDRIAALRAQVDRVTSRQLLDQQVVEEKVEKLLEQQVALSSRHGKLDTLLDRAEESGIVAKEAPVVTPPKPLQKASLSGDGHRAIDSLLGTESSTEATPDNVTLAYVPLRDTVADRADRVFSKVTLSLKTIEQEQLDRIQRLTVGATETASAIETILDRNGIKLEPTDLKPEADALGGPYLEPQAPQRFETSLDDLDTALSRLDTVRDTARKLPFANPAPGKEITSRFGNRVDPFLGRLAMHAGIDFRASTGGEIQSAGAGVVTAAGSAGGYGNMVEIDHGHGISTRYGHMSRVLVNVGDTVAVGDTIGLAGSTGRSTGPHLHYEVRRNGAAVDPMRFLNAGLKLNGLLN